MKKSDEAPRSAKSITRRVTPARRAAFDILGRVEDEGAYAGLLLAAATPDLHAKDRALAYELVLGVLRWQLWLDHLIEHLAGGRAAHSLDAPVRRALRLGLYQLRFLTRIPPSAAVNESVNLAHANRLRSAAGFINAVLRRSLREPHYDPAAEIDEPLARLAVASSHPLWLIKKWSQDFGSPETEAFVRANNEVPPVTFRLNPLRAESSAVIGRLEQDGAAVGHGALVPGAWRLTEGSASLLHEDAREGLIYLQDEASQMVAGVLDAQPGERILDACAAPGSKTTQIGAATRDESLIVAGDLYPHRLQILRASAARQGLRRIQTIVFDAEKSLPFAPASFDRVLVDAPCSGTGTLRHNPEIRWRISPGDIAELAARQKKILRAAAQIIRPGGRLVYSTCSVEPEENEAVITEFLQGQPDFRPAPHNFPEGVQSFAGGARTWPHRQGTDGFYVAVIERAA